MSKDIKIEKVGVPQEFDGVSKIVTSSPDFFQATWIPEEETTLIGKLKIHRNGHYDADNFMVPVVSDGVETEKQIYGFSEITVDVPIKPPGIIGDIDIDIPPIDIDIPPIDIDIPPIDIDIPPIDIVIPPIDIEIPEFPTDIIDITHIDDNGNIIAITRQDLEDMDLTIEDIDGMIDPVLTIDDFGNIDIVDSFGVDDFGGVEVIDLAVGDVDLKIDGLDDDGRTKFTDEYLPTSIELTVPPRKLVYHEGESIDLTGAIVSAKYRGGTAVWANEKYRNGIIPLGELSTSVTNGGSGGSIMPDEEIAPIARPLNISDQAKFICPIRHDGEIQYTINKTFTSNSKNVKMLIYIQDKTTSYYQDSDCEVAVIIAADDDGYAVYDNTGSIPLQFSYTTLGKTAYFAHYAMPVMQADIRQISPKPHIITGTGNYWNENALVWAMVYDSGDGKKTVTLSWPRPKDKKILTTSFEITMADDESEDNGNV